MEIPDKLPPEERKKLNRLIREGGISWNQFVNQMRNGLFDHERQAVRKKYKQLLKGEK
jgi:hypothetical protein